jgi:hypothetical protein
MSKDTQTDFQQIPFDKLILTDKEVGDFDSVDYIFQGNLGTYKMHFGHSITDDKKVIYVILNNKHFVTIFQTRRPKVLVGFDEEENEYMIFRFNGKEVEVFRRKYEI